MSTKQKNVVIFSGAGSSKAVDKDQYPATIEFFDRLPEEVTSDFFFKFTLKHVRSRDPKQIIDIELILWELQTLREFFLSVSDKDSIVWRAVAENILTQAVSNHGFGQFQPSASRIAEKLDRIIGAINKQVFSFYSHIPAVAALEPNWLELLKGLQRAGVHFDIFTTNYDLVIEAALDELGGENLLNKYRGIRGRIAREIDLKNWQEGANRTEGLLTKLHGSIDWKKAEEHLVVGDYLFTGIHSNHAIIYPGFKGVSAEPFFGPFHDYLSRSLAEADIVLVIGFAFRDDNINQTFRASLPRNAKVFQFDPSPTAKIPTNLKVSRSKYFDTASVNDFLGQILEY